MNTNLVCGAPPTIPIYGRPGTANASTRVFAEISELREDGTIGNLLSSDSVKVTTTLFIMGNHTNYGQLYSAEQDTRSMWDCNLEGNTYQTPKSEGKKYQNGKEDSSGKGDSYLESALNYTSGFTMDYQYTFLRGNGYGDDYGYVQADVKDNQDKLIKKLSFVANGGVKIGGTGGASNGVFEAAVLDVQAMVAMTLNKDIGETISDAEWNTLKTMIGEEGTITITNEQGTKLYAVERLNTLLNGVGYGQFYPYMVQNWPQNPDECDYIALLRNIYNLTGTSGNMKISATPTASSGTGGVEIKLGDTTTFCGSQFNRDNKTGHPNDPSTSEGEVIGLGDGHIYLQAHWGSGVKYEINSLQSKEQGEVE